MAITIYTTPSCGYCRMAKDWMRRERIPFKEYDVSKDTRRAEEMVNKSGQMGVPVLDVHGRVLVGFNQQELERALRR